MYFLSFLFRCGFLLYFRPMVYALRLVFYHLILSLYFALYFFHNILFSFSTFHNWIFFQLCSFFVFFNFFTIRFQLYFSIFALKKASNLFSALSLYLYSVKTKKNRKKKQTKSATVLMDDGDVEQRWFCSCDGCPFFTILLSLCSIVRVNTLLKRHNITFYMWLLAPLTTQKGLARSI